MAFPVVLDANVLYPIGLTDFFLSAANAGLYRPHWNSEILDEVRRNLLANHSRMTEEAWERRLGFMQKAFPDALHDPPMKLVQAMTNHEKDRHVLATAVHMKAEVVVTSNLRHFGSEHCEPHGIEAQDPDTFGTHLVDLNLDVMMRVLNEMSLRKRKPPVSMAEILDRLEEDLPLTVQMLRKGRLPFTVRE